MHQFALGRFVLVTRAEARAQSICHGGTLVAGELVETPAQGDAPEEANNRAQTSAGGPIEDRA